MISMGQLTYQIYFDKKGKQQAYKFLASELTAEFNAVSGGADTRNIATKHHQQGEYA